MKLLSELLFDPFCGAFFLNEKVCVFLKQTKQVSVLRTYLNYFSCEKSEICILDCMWAHAISISVLNFVESESVMSYWKCPSYLWIHIELTGVPKASISDVLLYHHCSAYYVSKGGQFSHFPVMQLNLTYQLCFVWILTLFSNRIKFLHMHI